MTVEDHLIWREVIDRWHKGWGLSLFVRAAESDGRDALLMYQAADVARFGPSGIQIGDIDVRGWSQS